MNDEYIRLDTTIIAIDNLINEAATGTMARTLFKAEDTIYNQQRYVIDVQPVKHGYWIDDKDYMMCSFCGLSVYDDYYEKRNANSTEYYNFCPYCGARMDLKEGEYNARIL